MKLATEVWVFGTVLRTAVVVLALAAIALFDRMSPAIEQIIDENVVTMEAGETMLAVLARPDLDPAEAEERFQAALLQAQSRLTEREEAPLLEDIERLWRALQAGQNRRTELVALVEELTAVNRRSMETADSEANRLGAAGAWTVAFLSLLILVVTQVFAGRLDDRVVQPLLSVAEVVQAAESGERHRRSPQRGPPEVLAISAGLNRLLDLADSLRASGRVSPVRDRALIGHLLDGKEGSWVVVDGDGDVVTANAPARQRLDGQGRIDADQPLFDEEVVLDGALRLLRLDAPPSSGPETDAPAGGESPAALEAPPSD
ncbi:MAG: hypothetical protein AAFU79_07180 [Myxococcota bacterium]